MTNIKINGITIRGLSEGDEIELGDSPDESAPEPIDEPIDPIDHESGQRQEKLMEEQEEEFKRNAMRLGVVFEGPVSTEGELRQLQGFLRSNNIQRMIVIGDHTGEICHACRWKDDNTVFALGYPAVAHNIKCIDPDLVPDLPPQELECLVMVERNTRNMDAFERIARHWKNHVKPQGKLANLRKDGWMYGNV